MTGYKVKELIININPGNTHKSYGIPAKLNLIIFFKGRLINKKTKIGTKIKKNKFGTI
tara:strand:+ start:4094 stop:4267 length:174 start_codon:yes stop_codon:yes gene_type:complete